MAYFPNSTAGEILDAQCADCPLGAGWNDPAQQRLFDDETEYRGCPVMLIQLTQNYKQLDKGQEPLKEAMTTLVANDGTCEVRKILVEHRKVAGDE